MRCGWLITLVLLCGCGSAGPFDYVPVSGTVAFDDGSPLPGGARLRFAPVEPPAAGKQVPRPALANVQADGKFAEVTSYKYGDGLIPGRHRVAIEASDQAGKSLVPPEYASVESSPLVIDTADAPLAIRVPRAKSPN